MAVDVGGLDSDHAAGKRLWFKATRILRSPPDGERLSGQGSRARLEENPKMNCKAWIWWTSDVRLSWDKPF